MDEERLTAAQKGNLLALARQSLIERLNDSPVNSPDSAELAGLQQARGAFVTLTLAGHLRGCIGTFRAAKPLWRIVQEMAVSAALHDPRFPSLQLAELDAIEIEVSALTPLRVISDTD